MTFTYSSTNLTTDLAKVRRLIGDTASATAEFTDEEINFYIDTESNIYGAASVACGSLAAKYASKVNKTVGKLKIDASDKYKHFKELSESYKAKAKVKGAPTLYAGGISVADKDSQKADSDRVEPAFYRDMGDYLTESSTGV